MPSARRSSTGTPATVVATLVGGLLLVVLASVGWPLSPAGAQDPNDPTVTTAPIAPPAASIVVDADTGEVISASNERQALPPASTTKVLTTLMARANLGLDAEITISNTASIAPPRRINLPAGTRWGVEDLVYAAMHCSCNDAAWALGQAAGGGSMAGFEAQAAVMADQLGLEDDPVVRDPAGLDDERSVRGGNLLSARDLAIIGRAYLADPELAAIARAEGHEWIGGDGKPHSVTNLNRFLGRYEGATGLKTGSTRRAGLTFIGSAERDGRTLIAVVLGSQNHYADARALLDAGFLLAEARGGTGDVLPAVAEELGTGAGSTTTTTTTTTTSTTTTTAPSTTADRADVAPGNEGVSSPALESSASDDGPEVPVVAVAGGAAVVGAAGVAVAARARQRRGRVDRRPARPRRRDRRRRQAPR